MGDSHLESQKYKTISLLGTQFLRKFSTLKSIVIVDNMGLDVSSLQSNFHELCAVHVAMYHRGSPLELIMPIVSCLNT